MALRDVKRRKAGMQKSQYFQGFSARYEKIRQAMIGPHNFLVETLKDNKRRQETLRDEK